MVFEVLLILASWLMSHDKTVSGRILFVVFIMLSIFVGYGIYLQWQNGFVSPYYFGSQ